MPISEARLREISQANLFRGVGISTPAVVELMHCGIPVLHFTRGGWSRGMYMLSRSLDIMAKLFMD